VQDGDDQHRARERQRSSSPGAITIDGVTPTSGDRVLVQVNQTAGAENGIYIWNGSGSAP
jgi:hypothetical protein